MSVQKWEYLVATFQQGVTKNIDLQDWLNEKGSMGWEAISFLYMPNNAVQVVFKSAPVKDK